MNMRSKLLRENFQPCIVCIEVARAGEGGGTEGNVIRESSSTRSNHLPFL